MTTSATSNNIPAVPHGPAHYRTTAHGTQVVIPIRCADGRHVLATGTCRIYETDHTLHIKCLPCAAESRTEHTWSLTTDGRTALSAEFDDQPDHDLLAVWRAHA
jgi:hypothetical protein